MPDGNAPSARVPTPNDDANASSRPVNGARAPSVQPSPLPPETHEQRLEALIAELTDARSSGLPLTDLLRAYDEELERIHLETVRNGGTIPLTMREQTLLTRAEAAREAITTTRTDDPRAQARELATRAKAATNPALAKGLRAELAALKERTREDGLTRELQRDPSSDLSVIDDTITRAEQGPTATSSTTDSAPEAGSMLLARQVRALKARLERAEQELEYTNTSANALETSINELEQAPEIEIRGVQNPFSSAKELEHLRDTQQRLLARQATLQTIVQDLTRANATLESLEPDERETVLQASEEVDEELDAPRDPLIEEGLARSRTRLAGIIRILANRSGRDAAAFVEAYERVLQPLNDLESPTPADETNETPLSAALQALATATQASTVVSPSPATSVSVQSPPDVAVSTTTTEEATIQSTREELRQRYAVRQQEQAILTTYRTQLQAHSWTYLQTQNPTQFQRLQTLQTELGTVIDPSSTLPPDALETAHQQAIVDVRAAYPDVTDAVLSSILLSQAATQLASASALQAGLSTAALETALGAMAGATAAAITGAGLVQALGAQQQAVATAADALAQEEAKMLQRATILAPSDTRVSTGGSDATPDVVMLRQAQQESAGKRRGLQAKLNVSLQQLGQWSTALGGATGTRARGLTPAALQALAVTSPKTFVFATKPAPVPQRSSPNADRIPFDDATRRMRRQQSTFAKNQALATAEAEEPDGIDIEQRRAAHLDSVKARTKRTLPRATEARSSSTERSASAGASVAAPLLALAATPTTPRAIFADQQARMNRERDAFIGVGESAESGYEAMFGSPSDASATSGDGSTINADNAEMAALADAQDQATEQAWEAELLRQQQQDARAQEDASNQPKDSSGRPTLQQAKQAGDLLKKAGSGAITGTVAAILVVVLILWLNIRLFFPNPESSWRKPLEPLGKLGVVLLDGLMILLTLLQFLFLMLILFLPILAIILPGAIIAGTILGGLGN